MRRLRSRGRTGFSLSEFRQGLLALVLLVVALPAAAAAQDRTPAVLWRAPRPLTSQDWICGPGGCDRTPAPPFEFVKEEGGGTNPKVTVRDARGLTWSVKFGAEVIPECFGSRFVTALGYIAEPTYCISNEKIEGVTKLKNARRMIGGDGGFRIARFELRGEKDLVFLPHREWGWDDNPFRGSHELAGLKIVMMLLSNWDAKDARDGDDSNNNIFRAPDNGRPELLYSVTDWGASLGHWGGLRRRDQSDCSGFAADTAHFVEGAAGGEVQWGYSGKHEESIRNGITVDDVRWLLPYLERIRPDEIRAGFKASGATDRQGACWTWAIESRIAQLRAVAQ